MRWSEQKTKKRELECKTVRQVDPFGISEVPEEQQEGQGGWS